MAKKIKKHKEAHPKSSLLEGLDKAALSERMKIGNYKGLDDARLRIAMGGKRKKKKSAAANDILSERRKKVTQKEAERNQSKMERKRIADQAIAVVDVSKEDRKAFIVELEKSALTLRNFMLKRLAATQFGVGSALDTVLQELNIIMKGGVSINAMAPFSRLNSEIALVAITKEMCKLYGLDVRTTRKIINAKIEFMRPTEFRPGSGSGVTDPNPRKTLGAQAGRTGSTK